MPTYDYRCTECGHEASAIQSIASYCREPLVPDCPLHQNSAMERKLSVLPMFSGLANSLAGDRHYDGLRATDGTDISSRSKHRAYMKANNLTTADDFQQTWSKNQAAREAFRLAQHTDKSLKQDIAEAIRNPGKASKEIYNG